MNKKVISMAQRNYINYTIEDVDKGLLEIINLLNDGCEILKQDMFSVKLSQYEYGIQVVTIFIKYNKGG